VDRKPVICGEAKGDWFDEAIHVDPTDPLCPDRFSYGLSGLVIPAASNDAAAEKMIDVLRLNEESLVYERGVLIAGIQADIDGGAITPITKDDEIAFFGTLDSEGQLPDLGHVAIRYLRVELV
jgi:hypothetical protein